MNEIRRKRIEKRILRLVSDLYFRELKDPNLGFSTFTQCHLSPDAKIAKILVSVYEDQAGKEKTLAALKKASGFIRGKIARNISMQNIPAIEFVLDESLEKAQRINDILDS